MDGVRTEANYQLARAALPEACPACGEAWNRGWAIHYVGQAPRADCGCGARYEWDGERWRGLVA